MVEPAFPRRLPNWGLITAEPHEHLVHIRRGRVLQSTQGGACFRWPGDVVALVDTSVHRLQFTADQVTREKVGVGVTGLAVYRVVSPEIAWRMLDMGGGHRTGTERPLAGILREMFVGATRRLVANLALEECLTRRKDALADELMAEILPVVQGQGRRGDTTQSGWGVALDTIEIQDVRVLSDEVFQRLQAPYREELALKALAARAQVLREEARLERERDAATESGHLGLHRQAKERLLAERDRKREERTHQAQVDQIDHEAKLARATEAAEAAVLRAELESRATHLRAEAEADAIRMRREAEATVTDDRLRELMLTETLPRVAEAFAGSFDRITVTGVSDLSVLSSGLGQVLATADAFGIRLPGQSAGPERTSPS
jgi:flotillin